MISIISIEEDPAQYTRLISIIPAANKPGELCRIRLLGIEMTSYLSQHNSKSFKISKSMREFY